MGQEKLPGPHFLVRMRGFAPQVALTRKCGPGKFQAAGNGSDKNMWTWQFVLAHSWLCCPTLQLQKLFHNFAPLFCMCFIDENSLPEGVHELRAAKCCRMVAARHRMEPWRPDFDRKPFLTRDRWLEWGGTELGGPTDGGTGGEGELTL